MAKQENSTAQKTKKSEGTEKVQVVNITNNGSESEQAVLDAFKKHLEAEGKTASTIKSYSGDIEAYFAYCKTKEISVNDGIIARKDILEYKADLIESDARAATVNVVLNSLRAYNLFAIKAGIMTEMVVDTKTDRVTNAALAALRADNKKA